MSDFEYIIVGKVGSTYGIKGWSKIHSFTENTLDLLNYQPWYLEIGKEWKEIKVSGMRQHGNGIVAKLGAANTPETARLLTGKKIAIKRSQLPSLAKDEYYWTDLVGLTVINSEKVTLGIVTSLLETGSNDVLIVKDKNNKEHGVPYLKSVILKVDLDNRIIHVDWDLI